MSWDAPVPIFDDEDEDALISKFVEMSAAYPKYSPQTITAHIFKDLRDPDARALQAAVAWGKNFDIRVRIDNARANGCKEVKKLSEAELEAKYLALAEDQIMTPNEKKVVKEIYDSLMKLNGWEKKANDGTDEDGVAKHFPTILYAVAEPKAQAAA